MNDHELDAFYWNDPLLTIAMKPSHDQGDQMVGNFAQHLDVFHKNIRDKIVHAPPAEQAALVSVVSSWAKHVAKDPLTRGDREPEGIKKA